MKENPSVISRPEQANPVVTLDLLRGLAALIVFLAHTRGGSFVEFASLPDEQRTLITAVLFGLTRLGHEAVLTFFVLSGFLVGGQIISQIKTGKFNLAFYAIDRCSRIFLPLWPACIFTAGVIFYVFDENITMTNLIGNMVGLNGILVSNLNHNDPVWSLAFEIWFYVLGGVVAAIITARTMNTVLVALCAMVLCAMVFSILPANFLLYWWMGALTSLCIAIKYKRCLGLLGLGTTVLGSFFYEIGSASLSFQNTVIHVPVAISEALICSGMCLTLPFLCSAKVNAGLLFLRKPALYISNFSYTLYLVHFPVNSVFDRFLPKALSITTLSLLHFVLRSVGCLSTAMIFHFFFEKRTACLRHYLKGKYMS
jgi:peptidoglycan/LPS O-acetylase OafA/YrhL